MVLAWGIGRAIPGSSCCGSVGEREEAASAACCCRYYAGVASLMLMMAVVGLAVAPDQACVVVPSVSVVVVVVCCILLFVVFKSLCSALFVGVVDFFFLFYQRGKILILGTHSDIATVVFQATFKVINKPPVMPTTCARACLNILCVCFVTVFSFFRWPPWP